MSVVYIAGPMTGRRHWNVDAFEEAERKLDADGKTVLSPIHHDRRIGFDHRTDTEYTPHQLRLASLHAAGCIAGCDEVCLLDGWTESKGARAEAMWALWLGKTVYDDVGDIISQEECIKAIAESENLCHAWGYVSA